MRPVDPATVPALEITETLNQQNLLHMLPARLAMALERRYVHGSATPMSDAEFLALWAQAGGPKPVTFGGRYKPEANQVSESGHVTSHMIAPGDMNAIKSGMTTTFDRDDISTSFTGEIQRPSAPPRFDLPDGTWVPMED
jgi:hypothetical protein